MTPKEILSMSIDAGLSWAEARKFVEFARTLKPGRRSFRDVALAFLAGIRAQAPMPFRDAAALALMRAREVPGHDIRRYRTPGWKVGECRKCGRVVELTRVGDDGKLFLVPVFGGTCQT